MEYTRLGNSGLKISKVIFGAMSFGSPDWQEWIIDEAAALPLLKHAYDVGVNTWDTADVCTPMANLRKLSERLSSNITFLETRSLF
jgi:aryl-alcohol dehydrogenase-like predicted oxidoreductase